MLETDETEQLGGDIQNVKQLALAVFQVAIADCKHPFYRIGARWFLTHNSVWHHLLDIRPEAVARKLQGRRAEDR